MMKWKNNKGKILPIDNHAERCKQTLAGKQIRTNNLSLNNYIKFIYLQTYSKLNSSLKAGKKSCLRKFHLIGLDKGEGFINNIIKLFGEKTIKLLSGLKKKKKRQRSATISGKKAENTQGKS